MIVRLGHFVISAKPRPPQRLKPHVYPVFAARLKACPDTELTDFGASVDLTPVAQKCCGSEETADSTLDSPRERGCERLGMTKRAGRREDSPYAFDCHAWVGFAKSRSFAPLRMTTYKRSWENVNRQRYLARALVLLLYKGHQVGRQSTTADSSLGVTQGRLSLHSG